MTAIATPQAMRPPSWPAHTSAAPQPCQSSPARALTGIGADNASAASHELEGLFQGHVLLPHQIGNHDRGRPAHARRTVHENAAALSDRAVDEVEAAVQVGQEILGLRVRHWHLLVREATQVARPQATRYAQDVRNLDGLETAVIHLGHLEAQRSAGLFARGAVGHSSALCSSRLTIDPKYRPGTISSGISSTICGERALGRIGECNDAAVNALALREAPLRTDAAWAAHVDRF